MKITFDKIETLAGAIAFPAFVDMPFTNEDINRKRVINSDRSLSSILTTTLSLNFVGIFVALLFEATFGEMSRGEIVGNFIDSFFYANYIGTLFGFAVLKFTPRLNRLRFPLNWLLLVSLILGLTFIGSLMAGFTLMWLGSFPPADYSWITLRRMGLGFLIALIFGISLYFYESVRLRLKATTEQLQIKKSEEELAQKLVIEASLSSLESRIHPHFLFNTLNSISSLIQEDAPLAERMVERLAALLRFSLDSNRQSTIPLAQELKIAVDYLEIEKARFGERLRYQTDVPAELNTVNIPPFTIQTLVENSVKYAVSVKRHGGEILIKANRLNGKIVIEVWDDGDGFTNEAIIVGHGLDNLRDRFVALFEIKAALEISRKNNYTVVAVSFPEHLKSGAETI